MDFIRLTGEAFIYTVLILLGGIAVTGLTVIIFKAIGIDAVPFCRDYVGIIGAFAAPVVAVYLADAKKSVIENIAPLLARIFAPLLLVSLVVFLVFAFSVGRSPFTDRDFLVSVDLMLLLVLALVIYVISARQRDAKPALYDWLVLVLIAFALVIDGVALSAVIFRLGSYGVSANKVAVLGLNVLFLGNLLLLAFRFVAFLRGRAGAEAIEKTQTDFLAAYFFWTLFVALAFPVIFSFA